MKLSPIEIYGIILPENAPNDIFYYYARVLGKSENKSKVATFEQIIDWCIEAPVIPDKINQWSTNDFSLFARFINPEIMTWTKAQLLLAWNFIHDILKSGITLNNQVPLGFPMPKTPKTISPLLAYSICSRVKPYLRLRGKTTEEMYTVARAMLFSGGISGLIDIYQQSIFLSLVTCNNEIEPILNLMKNFDETTKITSRNVKRRMNRTDRFSFIRQHIDDDINSRVQMGYFRLDRVNVPELQDEEREERIDEINMFSFYQDEDAMFDHRTGLPFITLSLIGRNMSDFEFGDTYAICLRNQQVIPDFEMGRENICAIIKAAYLNNRDISDADEPENVKSYEMEQYPLLNEDFNPAIPPKAYPLYILKELAFNEGIIERLEDIYDEYELHEMLQVNLVEPKFWSGFCNPPVNDVTLYLEDVNDISDPISFGPKGGPYYIFDPSELALYFNTTGTIQNPACEKLEYFTPTNIRQLLRIIDEGELKESIENIIKNLGTLEMKIQEFYTLYKQNEETKADIRKLIIFLHEIGMTMRGWNKEQDESLPIENTPSKDYEEVELQANFAISTFYSFIESIDVKIKECFLEIPIWKYRKGNYLRPNHEANTIDKRLKLILRGETTGQDENSCIRLGSNYICATSFRLGKTIGLDLGYNIEDLREIS